MNDRLAHLIMQFIASHGRDGDTMLAHINPREAALLKASGGRGSTNPKTGLPEFADGGFGGSAGGSTAGSSADTMSGFQFDNPGAVTTTPGNPAGKVDMFDRGLSAAITGLAGMVPGGQGLGIVNTASALAGGPNIAQSIANARAGTSPTESTAMTPNALGSFDLQSMSSGTPQTGGGLNSVGGPATGASVNGVNVGPGPQTGQSSGLDAFLSSYLQQPTPQTPVTPTLTPDQQALAARGFYTTPSTTTPTSAIDPVLQSAMLYARG